VADDSATTVDHADVQGTIASQAADRLPATASATAARAAPTATARVNPYRPRPAGPRDFAISLGEKGGSDRQLLHPTTAARQSLRGFDPTYVDIIDFIVRITHRIWEEKEVGYIYDVYRHNSRVTDDSGLQYGRDKIVDDTVHTINAFPDIRLYADEIVWAGDDVSGFHTSHRTVILGTNTGYSRYGPPTGRRIAVWCIANCVALENEIFEEHVLYNNSSMLGQLGFDLRTLARSLGNAAADRQPEIDRRFGEAERTVGQGKPMRLAAPEGPFDAETLLRYAYHEIWNWRNLNRVDTFYAPNVAFHGPTGREFSGRGEVKSFVLSMIAMFPDLAMPVDDVYGMGNDEDGHLTSTRWSAVGTHRGNGIYGPPTRRRVHIWGITQHRIVAGRIVEEWMLFNEFEVMQQIYRDAIPS
jgi:predicted ester cyclase